MVMINVLKYFYPVFSFCKSTVCELKKYRDQEKGIDQVTYDKLFGTSKLVADAKDIDYTFDGIQL